MASVATMTGTLIDSGCKHIIPVRVSMDTLLALAEKPDQNVLLRDKMRFCCHKSDLVLCVNKPIFEQGRGSLAKNAAYPNVVSTLGDISPALKLAIALFYHLANASVDPNTGRHNLGILMQFLGCLPEEHEDDIESYFPGVNAETFRDNAALERQIGKIPNFSFMGFSLGLGYAHPSSGDTAVSAMIGGMLSVQNGHYTVSTGDQIMWYFEFEVPFFDKDGRRRGGNNDGSVILNRGDRNRQGMHLRENGNIKVGFENNEGKRTIAYPKPFLPPPPGGNLGPMDKLRIFAKAVSNARPFDKLDLLICTQSI